MHANTQPVLMGCRHLSKLVLLVQPSLQTKWWICHLSGCCHKHIRLLLCPFTPDWSFKSWLQHFWTPDAPDTRTHNQTQVDNQALTKTKGQCRQCCPIGTLPSRGYKANCTILLKRGWAVVFLHTLWYKTKKIRNYHRPELWACQQSPSDHLEHPSHHLTLNFYSFNRHLD